MKAFLRGDTDEGGSPSLSPINALAVPEFVERGARLAKMDAQGVEACLILPTTGVGVEPQLRETPAVLYPSLRAFNRWLEEDWGFGTNGRIYGAPLLSLFDLEAAIAELERVLARGARFAVLTAGPVAGRSPADPYFDPFWARCEEAGLNVVYHIGRTPFSEMYNPAWGLRPHPPSHRHSLMEWALSFTERPVVDTTHRADRRQPVRPLPAPAHPQRRVRLELGRAAGAQARPPGAPVQQGHVALRHATAQAERHASGRTSGWRRSSRTTSSRLAHLIGAGHVLGGSDYPHPGRPARGRSSSPTSSTASLPTRCA